MEPKDVPMQIHNALTDVARPLTLCGLQSALKELESMGFTTGRKECLFVKRYPMQKDILTSPNEGEILKDLRLYIWLKYYGMWRR